MKTCKNCGASINDDSRFCTNCGADTFESGAEEQTTVLTEASVQPETDTAAAPEQSGEVYYQPVGETTESTASTYTYTASADQRPIGNGKKKKPVGLIIVIVVIILGIAGAALSSSGLFGGSKGDKISEGSVASSTEYVNDSLNLKIDLSGSNFETVSDRDMRSTFNLDPDLYETLIYDYTTGEMIVVFLFEGNADEVAQDIKEFTHDEAEYYYENQSNYTIGDVYEQNIGGKTYTCVDIGQNVENATYGDYYLEETLCVLRSGSTFIEIEIITYPEETGNDGQKLIDQFFKAAK